MNLFKNPSLLAWRVAPWLPVRLCSNTRKALRSGGWHRRQHARHLISPPSQRGTVTTTSVAASSQSRGDGATVVSCSGSKTSSSVGRRGRTSKEQQYTTKEFHSYFQAQYGGRWSTLYAAMGQPTRHVALLNAFLGQHAVSEKLTGSHPLPPHLPPLPPSLRVLQYTPADTAGDSYPPPYRDSSSCLSSWYWLDAASLLPPLALGAAPGHAVLDMCAAPGGKSLILAQLMLAAEGVGEGCREEIQVQEESNSLLVCNEIDPGRRRRLVGVLREYVPEDVRMPHIRVTLHDAAAFWRAQESETYDSVLLDAPCSSDRHIVQQAACRAGIACAAPTADSGSGGGALRQGEILKSDWSVKRCKVLAADQAKLLTAAVRALKPGGRLVYSTCSIADVENDQVVERVLQRAGGALVVTSHTLGHGCSSAARAAAAGGGGEDLKYAAASEEMHSAASLAAVALPAIEGEDKAPYHQPSEGKWRQQQLRQEWVTADDFMAWGAEHTQHGWLLLPDSTGWGPMYVCVLEKTGSSDLRRVKVNKYSSGAGSSSSSRGM